MNTSIDDGIVFPNWAPPICVDHYLKLIDFNRRVFPSHRTDPAVLAGAKRLLSIEDMQPVWHRISELSRKTAFPSPTVHQETFYRSCVGGIYGPWSENELRVAAGDYAEISSALGVLASALKPWSNGMITGSHASHLLVRITKEAMAEVFSSNDASIEWNDDVGIQTLYRILSQAQTEIEKAFARVNVLNPNSGRTDADQKIRYAVRTIVQGLLEMFDAPHHSIVQPTIKTLFGRDLSKEKISRMAKGERDQFGNWIVVSAR